MMELNRLDAPELHRRTLWHLFQEGQATRQSLKDALGCTLLTASKAVTALLESGLLVVDGTVSSAMGRRKSVLKLNPRHRLCLCADIGYGSLKVALVRFNGEIEKKIIIPGLPDPIQSGIPYEELLRVMEALILEAGCERILGVGVGISGMVHFESGRVLFCPNIQGFEDRPLAGELEERFGLPVLLDTSARCMTMGEYYFGAGRGVPNQMLLSLGTGSIAAGLLANGRIYRGPEGFAGEIGHTCVRPGVRRSRCSCGRYDCLELYASLQMLRANIEDSLRRFEGYSVAKRMLDDEPLTLECMREFVLSGDPVVEECFQSALNDVASVLVGAVNLFTPSLVVLGGGFPHFFPQIVDELQQRVLSACLPPMHTRLRLTGAALGEDASLRGAAGMLIQNYLMYN